MKPGQGEGPGRSSQALRHYRATLACPLATHVLEPMRTCYVHALGYWSLVWFCLLNECRLESGLGTARAGLYFGQGY
jgi:hypothetical protein